MWKSKSAQCFYICVLIWLEILLKHSPQSSGNFLQEVGGKYCQSSWSHGKFMALTSWLETISELHVYPFVLSLPQSRCVNKYVWGLLFPSNSSSNASDSLGLAAGMRITQGLRGVVHLHGLWHQGFSQILTKFTNSWVKNQQYITFIICWCNGICKVTT